MTEVAADLGARLDRWQQVAEEALRPACDDDYGNQLAELQLYRTVAHAVTPGDLLNAVRKGTSATWSDLIPFCEFIRNIDPSVVLRLVAVARAAQGNSDDDEDQIRCLRPISYSKPWQLGRCRECAACRTAAALNALEGDDA